MILICRFEKISKFSSCISLFFFVFFFITNLFLQYGRDSVASLPHKNIQNNSLLMFLYTHHSALIFLYPRRWYCSSYLHKNKRKKKKNIQIFPLKASEIIKLSCQDSLMDGVLNLNVSFEMPYKKSKHNSHFIRK